jgi:hypothetical protein
MSFASMDKAILEAPTLEDFWITWATVNTPPAWVSEIVAGPIVSLPLPVSMRVSKRTLPSFSASATVKGFIVEPGSKVSVKARLRNWLPTRLVRLFGL